ncbi:MAG TPA: DinB family protein [Bryobacteraceae bacterium]|jgi:hypothetical protein
MNRTYGWVSLFVVAGAALAQQKGAPADFATSIKNQYNQNKGYILKSAEKMPEDGFGWRPTGLEKELRTFGQLLVHIANENNSQCSRSSGQPAPTASDDSKAAYTKEQATKILADSFAFCDPVFNALTNQSITEMVKVAGRNNTTSERPRGTALISDLTHSNEQYGMIMVYFAIRGMTPVSHEGK